MDVNHHVRTKGMTQHDWDQIEQTFFNISKNEININIIISTELAMKAESQSKLRSQIMQLEQPVPILKESHDDSEHENVSNGNNINIIYTLNKNYNTDNETDEKR